MFLIPQIVPCNLQLPPAILYTPLLVALDCARTWEGKELVGAPSLPDYPGKWNGVPISLTVPTSCCPEIPVQQAQRRVTGAFEGQTGGTVVEDRAQQGSERVLRQTAEDIKGAISSQAEWLRLQHTPPFCISQSPLGTFPLLSWQQGPGSLLCSAGSGGCLRVLAEHPCQQVDLPVKNSSVCPRPQLWACA